MRTRTETDDDQALATIVDVLRESLYQRRRDLGLTQASVAEAAGITRNHYQLLEAGKSAGGGPANPRLSTLVALGRALQAPPLLGVAAIPGTYAVWRWADLSAEPSDSERQIIWDCLVTESERVVGPERAAAFVGAEEGSITLALMVSALNDVDAAEKALHAAERALFAAGFSSSSATITEELEVHTGREEFAGLYGTE